MLRRLHFLVLFSCHCMQKSCQRQVFCMECIFYLGGKVLSEMIDMETNPLYNSY